MMALPENLNIFTKKQVSKSSVEDATQSKFLFFWVGVWYIRKEKENNMRVLIQRICQAAVSIDQSRTASVGTGLLVLLGIEPSDDQTDILWLSKKIVQMRLFDDDQGVMNRSVRDIGGQVLLVSQFTLHASVKKGNRPSYVKSAGPEVALPLYLEMIKQLSLDLGKEIATGSFGADMQVSLINDGPVTIWIDSKDRQ